MDGDMEISVDKLPIKRLEHIEENGVERFPPDVDYDEKTVNLIRRIDFAFALEERDAKKQKKKEASSAPPWPWQSLVENLHLAHQELSVIIDLINTVEANDAVTVAGMTRPKPLPEETRSDLAVSVATKLQCFRHLGKYFKQSAKSLEQEIAREARFYGALIRLQQNWKIKRLRTTVNAPSSEGFLFDLSDNSLQDPTAVSWPSSLSMVRVDNDSAGTLAVNIPANSCRSFHFGFLGAHSRDSLIESDKMGSYKADYSSKGTEKESQSDGDSVRETHAILRKAHKTIFYQQVFDLVSREAFNPSVGVNVTGMRENYLQLSISPGISAFVSLLPSAKGDQIADSMDMQHLKEASDGLILIEKNQDNKRKLGDTNRVTYEIYLQQLFHELMFGKAKDSTGLQGKTQTSSQPTKISVGLLSHFCHSLSHRMFSSKVHAELENLVNRLPYLNLVWQPTWHSRTSAWMLSVKFPQSTRDVQKSNFSPLKNVPKSLFHAKVVAKDDCITVEGGGIPGAVSAFNGGSESVGSRDRFNCELIDLPMVLLLQVASRMIQWLHEEALMLGIKTNRDFLALSFELEQGETLSLFAHVDPANDRGGISWWLVLEDGFAEERKPPADLRYIESETGRFLGYLSLKALHSTLMDLVSLCNGSVRN